MRHKFFLATLVVSIAGCSITFGQCINQANGAMSTQLICLTPNIYGTSQDTTAPSSSWVGGLTLRQTGAASSHFPHFRGSSLQNLTALDTAVGTQLSLLPLVTPAAGVSFVFSGGVVSQATTSFGPILGERGSTLGRHRVHLGLIFQRFAFDELDGISLDHIPAVYQHLGAEPPLPGAPAPASAQAFRDDVIATENRIDLKVNQWTMIAAFGLTDKIDVSMALPILQVRMVVTSNAQVVKVPGSDASCLALLNTAPCHLFPTGATSNSYSSSGTASGIGDILFRVKGQVYKGEHAAAAVGGDLHFPTGDERNLLGSGTTGFRPFIALSYSARVTPHLDFGYEWNGSSILGDQITSTGQLTSARLPNQLFYIVGADIGITRKLTGAVDLIGQRVIGTTRIFAQTFTTNAGVTLPNITEGHQSYQMNNASLGLKYAPKARLVVTANVTFRRGVYVLIP